MANTVIVILFFYKTVYNVALHEHIIMVKAQICFPQFVYLVLVVILLKPLWWVVKIKASILHFQ